MRIHPKTPRAFAVSPAPLKRSTAYTPRSAAWTLYNPKPLADILGLSEPDVDAALEQTGFNKAVRIREEVIRWKERLRAEERELQMQIEALTIERRKLSARHNVVREQLANVRNLLRIPREKGED